MENQLQNNSFYWIRCNKSVECILRVDLFPSRNFEKKKKINPDNIDRNISEGDSLLLSERSRQLKRNPTKLSEVNKFACLDGLRSKVLTEAKGEGY